MVANTSPLGLPYPQASDRVADGWDHIRDLAEATDDAIVAEAAARAAADNALDARLDTLEAAPPGWTALTYATGWSSFAGGYPAAAYRKIGGIVHLRGLVKRDTTGSGVIGTLPAGHRPGANGLYPVVVSNYYGMFADDGAFGLPVYSGGGGWSTGVKDLAARMTVGADGTLTLIGYAIGTTVPYVSLSGITFPAEL